MIRTIRAGLEVLCPKDQQVVRNAAEFWTIYETLGGDEKAYLHSLVADMAKKNRQEQLAE